MKKLEDARALAERMVEIGRACGKKVKALLTDMNQPLGNAIGNSLEVIEALETLKGKGPRDLVEISQELTAQMFVMGGIEDRVEAGRTRFDSLIASGKGLEKFARVIAEQGGDAKVVEDYSRLPAAEHEDSVVASEDGWVTRLEAETLGRASMLLGAGRLRLDASVDPAVGLVVEKKVGDSVRAGERLAAVYTNDRSNLARALEMLRAAVTVRPEPVAAPPLILGAVPEE
jgi:thymidine phosphorylase